MNSKLLAICSRWVAIFICANAPTIVAAQTNSSAADFGDLVRSLLVPAGVAPSWNLGAHPSVHWKSPTPKPSEAHLAKDGLPMSRIGVVQIADGVGTNQSSQWTVAVAGSRASPLESSLSMGKQGDSGFHGPEELEAAGFKLKALCKPEFIGSGTVLYEISAAGYQPAVLAHEWSSGSAGTWMGLTLAYTKQRAAKLRCY